jgi:peptidylprolyl isomerase
MARSVPAPHVPSDPTARPAAPVGPAPGHGRAARRRALAAGLASVAVGVGVLATGGSPGGVPAANAAGSTCATPAPRARGAGSAAPAVKRLVRRVGTRTARKPRVDSPTSRPPRRLVRDDVVRCGGGRAAKVGDTVRVRYSLVLWGGRDRVVDTTWGRDDAIRFPLQRGALIDGWIEGVPGMRVGGRRVIVVPPAKGYGSAGTTGVPGGATLIFVVDLVGID